MSFFIIRNHLQAVGVIAIRFHTTIDSKGINAPPPPGGGGGGRGGGGRPPKKDSKEFLSEPYNRI